MVSPKWSWSNSSFASHDPLLSPLDEGATLSSLTCPLITCTGSRLIFTIEGPPPVPSDLSSPLSLAQGTGSLLRQSQASEIFCSSLQHLMRYSRHVHWWQAYYSSLHLPCESNPSVKSRSVHSSVSWSLPVSLLSSGGLPLTASTSRGPGRRFTYSQPFSHTHCHTCSLSFVSVLQAVQQSICCYLSVSLFSPPLTVPLLPIPFNHPLSSLASCSPPLSPPTNRCPASLFSMALPRLHCPLLTVQFAQEAHGTFRHTVSTQQKIAIRTSHLIWWQIRPAFCK